MYGPDDLDLARRLIERRRVSSWIDGRAMAFADEVQRRQPRGDNTIVQLPVLGNPISSDLIPIFHNGNTFAATAGTIASVQPTSTGTFNVLSFGAKGDGTTDDTAAIQAAINACQTAGGGSVFFPATTQFYSVTALAGQPALTVTGNNVTLVGNGQGSTIQLASSSPNNAFILQGNNLVGFEMRGLRIVGGGASPGTGVLYFGLIQLVAPSNCLFFDVFFLNSPSGMLAIDNGSTVIVDNCRFHMSGFNATAAFFAPMLNCGVNTASNRITVKNCEFKNALWHAIWFACTDSIVDGCIFDKCGEARIVCSPNYTVVNCDDTNGYIVSSSGSFIEAFADGGVIANNRVIGSGTFAGRFALNPNVASGIFASGGNTVIVGNYVQGCTGVGIAPWKDVISSSNPLSGQNITIANNVVVNNAASSSELPGSNGLGGILLVDVSGGNYANVSITGNACTGNGGVGDLQTFIPIANDSLSVRGNSSIPDGITVQGTTLTASTSFALLDSIPVNGGAITSIGGFRANHRTAATLTTGTGQFVMGFGGSAHIAVTGVFLTGDTVTYTLNGVSATFTVGASTDLHSVAVGLNAAINATLSANCSSVVTTTLASSQVANTASGNVVVSATDAAFELATTVTHSVSKSSAGGAIVVGSTSLIQNIVNYTTGAGVGAVSVVIDADCVAGVNTAFQGYTGRIVQGTSIVVNSIVASGSIDSTIAQSLRVYGKLSNGGDSLAGNVLRYERI